jgi:hypothetical protein
MNKPDDEYVQARRNEILDGKRSWGLEEVTNHDPEVFYVEYVLPLRQLRADGMIEKLVEHERMRGGTPHVDRIDIVGGTDFLR